MRLRLKVGTEQRSQTVHSLLRLLLLLLLPVQ
jgi:hypothetical protein